jgi:hypothetical protein
MFIACRVKYGNLTMLSLLSPYWEERKYHLNRFHGVYTTSLLILRGFVCIRDGFYLNVRVTADPGEHAD